MSNQQIKSMLADAALILQQSMPSSVNQDQTQAVNPGDANSAASRPPSQPQATQGTPVTLASLSAQLESIRSMAREHEIRMFRVDNAEGSNLLERAEALLDSGATHAVVSFRRGLGDLESVPVTLAGDSKDEWLRTAGGTLVVPPSSGPEGVQPPPQTILPLGALVQTLGCTISWSKRKGLKVFHPTMGLLRTGISRNSCPYVQECQALELIKQLEESKLRDLQSQVQNLECRLREVQQPNDPTQAIRDMIRTGARLDVLQALISQPYLKDIPDSVKSRLAEGIPLCDTKGGREVLKGLPLRRSYRRALLNSNQWLVHLCSGPIEPHDPIHEWAKTRNCEILQVDVCNPGGKGWDLAATQGVLGSSPVGSG